MRGLHGLSGTGTFGIAMPAGVTPTAATAAAPTPAPGVDPSAAASALPIALQAAQAILGPQDAFEDAAVIEARIKNYQTMKRKLPALAWWYDNEINKLKAKLDAAKRRAQLQAEGEQATREWRTLGYALAAGGVLVLVGGAVALVRVSGRR